MFTAIITSVSVFFQSLGYAGIFFLMAIESSFIPFPSEIVVPPAAYLASQGKFDVFLVFLAGLLGSLLGAIFNYFLARFLGRPLVYRLAGHRYARWLLIDQVKLEKAEKFFSDHSGSATLIGRLVPVVRQLISLPAGFCLMPFFKFIVLTTIGSGVWVAILTALGYFVGANQNLLLSYYREISLAFLLIASVYLIFLKRRPSRR
jgi:membrane protein DedA with SNARE-associated domain